MRLGISCIILIISFIASVYLGHYWDEMPRNMVDFLCQFTTLGIIVCLYFALTYIPNSLSEIMRILCIVYAVCLNLEGFDDLLDQNRTVKHTDFINLVFTVLVAGHYILVKLLKKNDKDHAAGT